MDYKLTVDIVVATYNRDELLLATLESLSRHIKDNLSVNVIVVNNNSTDNTKSVSESFKFKFKSIICVLELQQGLSYSRNCGIQIASGDIVVFLDDDVELHDNWLDELLVPFKHPEVAVVGGKVLPFGLLELPEWLPKEYGFLASVFDPADRICEIDKVMGANFAVRRSVFEKVGLFDVNLGRNGEKLLGGEEVELFYRIKNAGLKIVYTPDSVVWHKISNKLNREYIENYAYWLGVSEALIDKKIVSRIKYNLKLIRSVIYPKTVNTVQKWIQSSDPAGPMRYIIKKKYAKGYLSHVQSFLGLK